MSVDRSEPFRLALAELRRRLALGVYPADTRLTAGELAHELGLSPTPMREALARLAGEGLLEDRRGQGFFLRRLSARDVADLYRLNLAHLHVALESRRGPWPREGAAPEARAEPDPLAATEAVDRLFAGWVAEAGGALVTRSYLRVQLQLAPVRRMEPRRLADLVEEHLGLAKHAKDPPAERLPAVRAFFRRRIRLAAELAESLEPPPLTR